MKSILPSAWKVPESLARRLGESAGRQRAMTAEGQLLLVLHRPPDPTEPEREARIFWRDADRNWKSNALGSGLQALKTHVAEFAARVDELEAQWQQADNANEFYQLLQSVAPLHRTARNLHASLQQAREMFPDDRDLINLRDQAYEVERGLELLHGDAKNGLDYTVAFQTEEQTQRAYEMGVSAHRLNILVALFFPIATLTAVFGMNLTHGLSKWDSPLFFWGVLGAGLLFGLILAVVVASRPAPLANKSTRPASRK